MKYSQLIDTLQNLTMTKVNLKEIADIIGKPVRTLYTRGQRDSNFSLNEIKLIENHYNIKLLNAKTTTAKYTFERYFNPNIIQTGIGQRLIFLQEKNHLSNRQMSGILDISEDEFQSIIKDKITLNLELINNLKQNFKISVDWLLYGE